MGNSQATRDVFSDAIIFPHPVRICCDTQAVSLPIRISHIETAWVNCQYFNAIKFSPFYRPLSWHPDCFLPHNYVVHNSRIDG